MHASAFGMTDGLLRRRGSTQGAPPATLKNFHEGAFRSGRSIHDLVRSSAATLGGPPLDAMPGIDPSALSYCVHGVSAVSREQRVELAPRGLVGGSARAPARWPCTSGR